MNLYNKQSNLSLPTLRINLGMFKNRGIIDVDDRDEDSCRATVAAVSHIPDLASPIRVPCALSKNLLVPPTF